MVTTAVIVVPWKSRKYDGRVSTEVRQSHPDEWFNSGDSGAIWIAQQKRNEKLKVKIRFWICTEL